MMLILSEFDTGYCLMSGKSSSTDHYERSHSKCDNVWHREWLHSVNLHNEKFRKAAPLQLGRI